MSTSPTKRIVRIAMLSAILVLGKLALSFIPNVEVVTACTLIFAFVFGGEAIAAAFIFCIADMFLYSFALDVALSYFTYWPLLATAGIVARCMGAKSAYVYAIIGVLGSLAFGVITSLYYALVYRMPVLPYFLAGIPFYALQMASALAFILVAFSPLTKLLSRFKE